MSELRFEWDTDKAAANGKKHKVSFDEAQTSFLDEDALVIEDPTILTPTIGSSCWA